MTQENREMVCVTPQDRALFARTDAWITASKKKGAAYKGVLTYGQFLDDIQKMLSLETVEVSRLIWARRELQNMMN